MTNEAAAKITAEVTIATIQHMADEVGLSFDATLAAILAGGNARRRFEALMQVAVNEVRNGA